MQSPPFLGLDFQPVTLNDKQVIADFLKRHPQKLSTYTFATLASWNLVYFYEWTILHEETLLLTALAEDDQRLLLQPIGKFTADCEKALLQKAKEYPSPFIISLVDDSFIEEHSSFCSYFDDRNELEFANYVYRSVDLANLAGGHYEKKRNLIAQAESLYQWAIHPLTKECHPRCIKMLLDIGPKASPQISEDLAKELKVLEFVLSHFEELDLKGVVLCVDEHPVAFAIYEELNPSTAVIHFEKADRQYKGMYQLINRETAKIIYNEGYEFINREEDLGIAGLRQAKHSYFPIYLESSHQLTFKR